LYQAATAAVDVTSPSVHDRQVSSANAQKRRLQADEKMKQNVNKRGMVGDPAAEVRSAPE
jgi:hypothetical protein